MCDRGRAAVGCRCGQLPGQALEDPLAHAPGRELEDAANPGPEDPVDRLLVVRVARERPGDARDVEHQRDAGHRYALRQQVFGLDGESPALRGARLEQ